MATGVLTVAKFVGKVGCYLLVASLSGRLRASLSGRLTAFLPPDHKADGFRHCDGGTHGGEICWESRMLPLGCESLRTPQGVPLGTPHGVPPPRSQSRRVPSSRRGCAHGGEICWESRKLPLGCESLGTPQGVPPPRSQSRRVPSSRRGCAHGGEICWESRKLPLGCESLGTPQGVPLGTPHGVPPPRSQSRWVPSSRRGALGGEICPSRELDDPLASQQPCRGLLGPEALPLAPGCDLSDPSQVMEPRGPTSHTAMAMDPVHGNQSSFGSTDVTLTAQ